MSCTTPKLSYFHHDIANGAPVVSWATRPLVYPPPPYKWHSAWPSTKEGTRWNPLHPTDLLLTCPTTHWHAPHWYAPQLMRPPLTCPPPTDVPLSHWHATLIMDDDGGSEVPWPLFFIVPIFSLEWKKWNQKIIRVQAFQKCAVLLRFPDFGFCVNDCVYLFSDFGTRMLPSTR